MGKETTLKHSRAVLKKARIPLVALMVLVKIDHTQQRSFHPHLIETSKTGDQAAEFRAKTVQGK